VAVEEADSFAFPGDIKPFMEEFCKGANDAATIVIGFLVLVGLFHGIAVGMCVALWIVEKFRKDRE